MARRDCVVDLISPMLLLFGSIFDGDTSSTGLVSSVGAFLTGEFLLIIASAVGDVPASSNSFAMVAVVVQLIPD